MGIFRDSRGTAVGETGHGYFGNMRGSCEGKFYPDGTIVQYGRIIGRVGEDGRVYDRNWHDTGYTYDD